MKLRGIESGKITLVPEGSTQANRLRNKGAGGLSTPKGTYVRYEYPTYFDDVEKLVEVIRHEWFHSYERETQALFDINYEVTKVALNVLYDFSGKPYAEGWHTVHPDEAQARVYSGAPAHPYPIPQPRSPWKDIFDWALTVFK